LAKAKDANQLFFLCGLKKAYQRSEILIVMRKEFPQYAWGCIKTLDRRLRHINYDTPLQDVKNAVENELEGPGKLLGVRAMAKKLCMVHDIKVPRDLVNDVMYEYDPDGLAERQPCKKGKQKKGNFVTQCVNWVWTGTTNLWVSRTGRFPLHCTAFMILHPEKYCF
jgi:hypothetical protein